MGFILAIKKVNRMFKVFDYLMQINKLKLKWHHSIALAFSGYSLCVIWPITLPVSYYFVIKRFGAEDE